MRKSGVLTWVIGALLISGIFAGFGTAETERYAHEQPDIKITESGLVYWELTTTPPIGVNVTLTSINETDYLYNQTDFILELNWTQYNKTDFNWTLYNMTDFNFTQHNLTDFPYFPYNEMYYPYNETSPPRLILYNETFPPHRITFNETGFPSMISVNETGFPSMISVNETLYPYQWPHYPYSTPIEASPHRIPYNKTYYPRLAHNETYLPDLTPENNVTWEAEEYGVTVWADLENDGAPGWAIVKAEIIRGESAWIQQKYITLTKGESLYISFDFEHVSDVDYYDVWIEASGPIGV